ncbi:hypothetical protein AAG570_003846 [Ranatra chinensis]|uniref:Uncharacterized protein n=1 Tax=Ranatra chinensis TaxID=642074 RepID=A0ABD0YQJ7_9HEMI
MASKRQNMFYQNKEQKTTGIVCGVGRSVWLCLLAPVAMKVARTLVLAHCLAASLAPCLAGTQHTRNRRYLAFPKGSSLQLVYCFIVSALGANDLFTIGITVGIAWEIPTNLRKYLYYNTPHQLHARDRRHIYRKVETFIGKLGEDGRGCVLRTICETANNNSSSFGKPNFLRKILQTIFSFPLVEAEDVHHEVYNKAAAPTWRQSCANLYPCNLHFLYKDVT